MKCFPMHPLFFTLPNLLLPELVTVERKYTHGALYTIIQTEKKDVKVGAVSYKRESRLCSAPAH